MQYVPGGMSAGIWMFGQFVDRYAADGYSPPVDTLESIATAEQVGGLVALDLIYPFAGECSVDEVQEALEAADLRASVVSPNIFNGHFKKGSFTNPDPQLRSEAREVVEATIAVASELGADYVKFWPGQDGYDYPFQADYRTLWDLSVQGIGSIATDHPETQFAIEYKPKEPRTHMFFSSAAKTLLAIDEMDVSNVGIVLDMGHSLYAKETPAEALHLVNRKGRLTGIEINDNLRDWDDDLTVGSVHIIETLEFLKAVSDIGWSGLIQLDQFPFRDDPVEAANVSLAMVQHLLQVVDALDSDALAAAQASQDALAAQKLIQSALFAR